MGAVQSADADAAGQRLSASFSSTLSPFPTINAVKGLHPEPERPVAHEKPSQKHRSRLKELAPNNYILARYRDGQASLYRDNLSHFQKPVRQKLDLYPDWLFDHYFREEEQDGTRSDDEGLESAAPCCANCRRRFKELLLYQDESRLLCEFIAHYQSALPLQDPLTARLYSNFQLFTLQDFKSTMSAYARRPTYRGVSCKNCRTFEAEANKAHYQTGLLYYKLEGILVFIGSNEERLLQAKNRVEPYTPCINPPYISYTKSYNRNPASRERTTGAGDAAPAVQQDKEAFAGAASSSTLANSSGRLLAFPASAPPTMAVSAVVPDDVAATLETRATVSLTNIERLVTTTSTSSPPPKARIPYQRVDRSTVSSPHSFYATAPNEPSEGLVGEKLERDEQQERSSEKIQTDTDGKESQRERRDTATDTSTDTMATSVGEKHSVTAADTSEVEFGCQSDAANSGQLAAVEPNVGGIDTDVVSTEQPLSVMNDLLEAPVSDPAALAPNDGVPTVVRRVVYTPTTCWSYVPRQDYTPIPPPSAYPIAHHVDPAFSPLYPSPFFTYTLADPAYIPSNLNGSSVVALSNSQLLYTHQRRA